MKRRIVGLFAALFILGLAGPFPAVSAEKPGNVPAWLDRIPADFPNRETARADLAALCSAYPGLCRTMDIQGGRLLLVLHNADAVPYDDGRTKTFEETLNDPDIQDMFSLKYQSGPVKGIIDKEYDPGRFRVDKIFKALYGDSAAGVRSRLVRVDVCGKKVSFHGDHGASRALAGVAEDLNELIRQHPKLQEYILPMGGTFNWRMIADTNRLSPHSFGAAIDLNTRKGAYWRWTKKMTPEAEMVMRQAYPIEIVQAFEDHGFIWGGKWGHFDLMHFEYRPELIAPPAK
jgi:hypothetical protein